MAKQPTLNPPQALRDLRWERNRHLLNGFRPERLNTSRRIIWRELNRAETQLVARLFLWWLAIDYLIIGVATQLLSLWYAQEDTRHFGLEIAAIIPALLTVWKVNVAYLTLLALLRLYVSEHEWTALNLSLKCKLLILAVPACFPHEYGLYFLDRYLRLFKITNKHDLIWLIPSVLFILSGVKFFTVIFFLFASTLFKLVRIFKYIWQ